uniref:Uncharacterized protein n=1 Tax=Anopheles albimanus TaxID=7167 RepID=A0A182FXL4_ANOAL
MGRLHERLVVLRIYQGEVFEIHFKSSATTLARIITKPTRTEPKHVFLWKQSSHQPDPEPAAILCPPTTVTEEARKQYLRQHGVIIRTLQLSNDTSP